MSKKLLFIFSILLCFEFANAATITSTGTGDWSSTTSWVGGAVPTINDDVIIATGSVITISSNVSAKSITINGTLVISGDQTVTTPAGNTLYVVINGTLGFGTVTNKNSITFPAGTNIAINSPGKIDDTGTCNNNVAIYIGTTKFAVCAGGGNSEYTFAELNNAGGTLQPNPTSSAPACVGNSLTFTADKTGAVGDAGALNWWWDIKPSGSASFTKYPDKQSVVSFASAILGTYDAKLTYTTTYSGNFYTSSKTISVTVNAKPIAPTITPSGATTFCAGGSVTLSSSAGTSYLWSTGATTQSIAVTASGSYTVQVANASGCLSSASVPTTVTVNAKPAAPTITPSGLTTFCAGGSVTLTSTAGSGYLWSTGATTQSIAVTTSGSYTVQVTNAAGCLSLASAGTTVTVNPKPAAPTISTSGSTTFCEGGNVTLTSTAGSSYLWSTGATTQSIAVTTSGTYTVQVTNASGCLSLASAGTTVTVNPKPATPTISASGSTTFCEGDNITLTSTAGSSYLWSTGATTQSIVVTTSGNYTVQVGSAFGCQSLASAATTVTVKPVLNLPTVFNTIQPTCVTPTGSISLSGLPSTTPTMPTWTIQQSGPIPRSYTGGTDPDPTIYTITGLSPGIYSFTVQYGDYCPVTINNVEIKASETNIWNGPTLGWSKGSAPTNTSTESIEFAEDYQSVGDLKGCSCKVDSGKKVTINSGNTLTITNGLIVDTAAGTSLTFEDDASLLQVDAATNSGNIIYKRDTAPVRRYDFTYWATPITNNAQPYTLHDLSPNTLLDKYESYDSVTGAWDISLNGTRVMVPAVGYAVRAPQFFSITVPAVYSAIFTGVPNNGDYTVPIYATKWSLIGNPYPSAIDAEEFITLNHNASPSVDVGALYFWTHNTPPSSTPSSTGTYDYTSNDYAVFSLSGGVSTGALLPDGSFGPPPTGKIAACQSFFMLASGSGVVKFTNEMRIGGDNNQFFKTAKKNTIEKNRIWLNLTNAKGAFKQVLVGYIEGASNAWDENFDAATMNSNSFIDFYSINDGKKLTIQGRALPFENTDVVLLGYKTTVAGEFTIAIDHVDGLFDNQAVYLEDKVTGIVTDLQTGNYTFTTAIGTFIDRFTISYIKKTLGTDDFENLAETIFVSVKDKNIKVTSSKEALKEVVVFDILGKMLYHKNKIANTELQISNLQSASQILLVKVILENGNSTSRKIVF